ncbi:MAG: ABC transporter substrate-binding protein [Fibrobacterota bacterium]|nr:ABC transporter substrate-binding protein [Fibrobacterota bacterium]QQS04166.1 MAG: ABC transporter substrate-binding protein [Fibrobacterota bacterium]
MSIAKLSSLVALVALSAFAQTEKDPVELIKGNDKALLSVLKSYKPEVKAQKDSLRLLVNTMFSFKEMGKRSLGKTWATLSKADQDSFQVLFHKAVENTSIRRLERYKADSTRYSVSGAGEKTVVKAVVFQGTDTSNVVYKMFQENGKWIAWDLVIDQSSSLNNYRDQFKTIIADKGFPAVLSKLRAKAKD